MRRYFWDIAQDDKLDLMDAALLGSGKSSLGVELFGEGGDRSRLLSKHRNGDRKRISVDLASELIEAAEPDFPFNDPEIYVDGSYTRGDTEYLDLDDEFRSYLFTPYSDQKLADITGKSPATCREYRFRSESSVPRDVYQDIFENTREVLFGDMEFSAGIEKTSPGSSDYVIETADFEDVALFDKLEDIKQGKYNQEVFESLIGRMDDIASNPVRGIYIRPNDSLESRYCSLLEGAGVIDSWGAKTYKIADEEYVDILSNEFS